MKDADDLRMTRQRQVILEELQKERAHPTADELFKSIRKRLPRISLATVYRNLKILCELDLLRRIDVPGFQSRYDAFLEPHHHIHCVKCGRVDDLECCPVCAVAQASDQVAERTDYEILGHHLEFIGVCPACKKKRRKS